MPMPETLGYLFPGQGAQYVGMGRDLYEQFPAARKIFDAADRLAGFPLSRLCFEGPEEKLTRTLYAQPAIFTVSLAALEALREKFHELTPSFAAGLSLGEFTALVAVGSFSFEDGFALVRERAAAMERAAQKHPGTMASILGLSQTDCGAIAKEAGCELANLNAPDQTVLSGSLETVEKACLLAEGRGAKRAIRLKVGGAFHSALMEDAKSDLEKALTRTPLKMPHLTFVPNAAAAKVTAPDQIRSLLARQLTSPVRWVETMACAWEEGIRFFLEIGPGKVLKGLARKSRPEFAVEPCGTIDDIHNLEQLFAKA